MSVNVTARGRRCDRVRRDARLCLRTPAPCSFMLLSPCCRRPNRQGVEIRHYAAIYARSRSPRRDEGNPSRGGLEEALGLVEVRHSSGPRRVGTIAAASASTGRITRGRKGPPAGTVRGLRRRDREPAPLQRGRTPERAAGYDADRAPRFADVKEGDVLKNLRHAPGRTRAVRPQGGRSMLDSELCRGARDPPALSRRLAAESKRKELSSTTGRSIEACESRS